MQYAQLKSLAHTSLVLVLGTFQILDSSLVLPLGLFKNFHTNLLVPG
jgi:hypothetical protein